MNSLHFRRFVRTLVFPNRLWSTFILFFSYCVPWKKVYLNWRGLVQPLVMEVLRWADSLSKKSYKSRPVFKTNSLYLFLPEERFVLLKMESQKHTRVSYEGVSSGFDTCAYCGILARSIVEEVLELLRWISTQGKAAVSLLTGQRVPSWHSLVWKFGVWSSFCLLLWLL